MVDLREVAAHFAALEPGVAGVFLWGSHARGNAHARSDIDVCIVAGPGADPVEVLLDGLDLAVRSGRPYDVRVFEELPLFLKAAVLEHGITVFARDAIGLQEYVRPWRKVWADQVARAQQRGGALAPAADRPG